jgi:hypothetical protein
MVTKMVRVLAAVFIVAGIFSVLQHSATAAQAVNAVTVAEHLDKGKYTSREIKTYLKGLKGQEIAVNGKINDIMSGKTGTRVVVFTHVPGRDKDFVVDVYVDNASNLHKGNQVSCSGTYHRYNMFTLNGVTLIKGSCSK